MSDFYTSDSGNSGLWIGLMIFFLIISILFIILFFGSWAGGWFRSQRLIGEACEKTEDCGNKDLMCDLSDKTNKTYQKCIVVPAPSCPTCPDGASATSCATYVTDAMKNAPAGANETSCKTYIDDAVNKKLCPACNSVAELLKVGTDNKTTCITEGNAKAVGFVSDSTGWAHDRAAKAACNAAGFRTWSAPTTCKHSSGVDGMQYTCIN